MQDKYVQSLRYKLQKRVRRANSAKAAFLVPSLKMLFGFIESSPLLAAVRDDLLARSTAMEIEGKVGRLLKGEVIFGENEVEAAAIGYQILKQFIDGPETVNFLDMANHWGIPSEFDEAFDFARTTFLEPFYEYLDEHIDDVQSMLFFLRQYKHGVEWFDSEILRIAIENDTVRGEAIAAKNLYSFLHGQGVPLFIEPKSTSGIADFVTEQVGDDRVIADTKLFWPEKNKGKTYLIHGLNQIYTYCRDFNEPCGYIVIFKMCKEDLNFLMPSTNSLFPSFTINNKTIFFVVIDLYYHGASASKRGKFTAIDITDTELVHSIDGDKQD